MKAKSERVSGEGVLCPPYGKPSWVLLQSFPCGGSLCHSSFAVDRDGCLESLVQRKEVLGLPGVSSPCHLSPKDSIPACPKMGDDSPHVTLHVCVTYRVTYVMSAPCPLFEDSGSLLWGGEETVWHGRGVG